MNETIDYLMAEDFEERFGFDPWDIDEVSYIGTHESVLDTAMEEGKLISITDEGMVMVGWRMVNITYRGICPIPITTPNGSEFLNGKPTS